MSCFSDESDEELSRSRNQFSRGAATYQLKNQRPSNEVSKVFAILSRLPRCFAQICRAPEGIVVHRDYVTLTKEQVKLPFECSSIDAFLSNCTLSSFLLDFTFKTNCGSLLIGSVGPAGLHVTMKPCSWSNHLLKIMLRLGALQYGYVFSDSTTTRRRSRSLRDAKQVFLL